MRSVATKRHEKDVNKRVREELKSRQEGAMSRRLVYIAFGATVGILVVAPRDPGRASASRPAGVQQLGRRARSAG